MQATCPGWKDGRNGNKRVFESPLVCRHALNTARDGRANKMSMAATRLVKKYRLNLGEPDLLAIPSGAFLLACPPPAITNFQDLVGRQPKSRIAIPPDDSMRGQ